MYPLINRDNSCSFSGYRPEKLPWGADESDSRCKKLKETLSKTSKQIIMSGIRHFICGMARGSDTYFCEAMLLLREKHQHITIEAAIPYEKQAEKWQEEERNRYDRLVAQCDITTYVSREYSRNCMLRRNRYMIDNSSVLIAVYDGQTGGTKHTIGYAKRHGLEIIEILPYN